MPNYTDAISRNVFEKLGETPSVLDFGAVGDGTTDDTTAFQAALDSVAASGGGRLLVPKQQGATYSVGELNIPSNVWMDGEPGAELERRSTIPSGYGWLNISGTNARVTNITFEGAITTAAQYIYGSGTSSVLFDNNPMDSKLTANTTIWMHPGAANIQIGTCTFRHSGGYAVLLDARDADISEIDITGCTFENNRPYTFGTSTASASFGGWGGGIHYQSDSRTSASKLFAVSGLRVVSNTFRRGNGVACWGHSYGFDRMHTRVIIANNIVEDNGFHGLQLGNVNGGVVEGNILRRIGYVCDDDVSASVPRYLSSVYASAIDMAGLVLHSVIRGNTVISANGDCFDLDGLAYSSVTGNVCVIPSSGEPEYTEDSIASIGPGGTGNNWTYGMQTGNTNLLQGGEGVTISGNTFRNMGGGAIRLYAARFCHVSGNNIEHPAAPNVPPIIIGNTGTTSVTRANGNVIANNRISYDPASPLPAIYEDATLGAWSGTEQNWVLSNVIIGAAYDFESDANTISASGLICPTNDSTVSDIEQSRLQHEGAGTSAALKIYHVDGGGPVQMAQLQPYRNGGTRGPILNVSDAGAAGSGIIATGDRVSFGQGDLVATGKALTYGFTAYLGVGHAASVYSDAAANVYGTDWALMKYDESVPELLVSTAVASGTRVWTTFGGGGVPGGSDTEVQFNAAGSFDGDPKFTFNSTTGLLTVNASTNTAAAIAVGTGFVQSAHGFLTTHTAADSIQAPSGGVTAKYFVTSESIFGLAVAAPAVSAASQGKLHYNSSANKWQYSENGSSWGNCFGVGSVAGADTEVQFNNSGAFGADSAFTFNSTSNLLTVNGTSTAAAAIAVGTGYIQSAQGFLSTGTAATTVNVASGGVTALSLISVRNDADSGLVLSRTSATARDYGLGVDASGNFILRDRTGTANRLSMSTAGTITIGTTLAIDQSGNLTMSGVLNCNGASGGVNVSSNSAYNSIQSSNNGGMAARSFTASVYVQVGQNAGDPTATTSDTLNNGAMYYNSSTGKLRAKIAGAFVDVATGSAGGVTSLSPGTKTGALTLTSGTGITVADAGGSNISITNSGVTSLTAGTGVSVTATTGAITVSIGQAVATSSNVTFASVTTGSGGVLQSGATGASIAFQTTNFNFQVNGNGVVSSAGGYNVSGTTRIDSSGNGAFANCNVTGSYQMDSSDIINSSRQFVGAGVLCQSSGIGGGGFNPWNGSGYDTGATGTATLGSISTIVFRGGAVIGWS